MDFLSIHWYKWGIKVPSYYCIAISISPFRSGNISFKIIMSPGVPVVTQDKMNPTSNYEVVGLIPGLTQWVKDLVLP